MASILIVEDDAHIRAFLTELLEDEGYAATGATNGRVALQALAAAIPDLIITDILMPEMDGITLCSEVQANPLTARIPIIVCSASHDQVLGDPCAPAAFLSKPFHLTTVLDTITAVLTRNS
jgi:CheY-like chemotaxis protein